VDVIAHGMWNWGVLDHAAGLPDEIKKVLDQIVEKRIGYQATIQVLSGLSAYFDTQYMKLAGDSEGCANGNGGMVQESRRQMVQEGNQ